MAVEIRITVDQDGQRLDRLVKALAPHVGFGAQQKWFRTGQVRLNGKRVKGAERLSEGDLLRLPPQAQRPEPTANQAQEPAGGSSPHGSSPHGTSPQGSSKSQGPDPKVVEELRRSILHDDGAVLAFNKPSGLAVQGGSKTLRHVDGALSAFTSEAGAVPRLVHRLDRDTSGVLVTGRGREVAAALTNAFAARDARKTYFAIVSHWPEDQNDGLIDAPLIKARVSGEERVMVDFDHAQAQAAQTLFRVERRAANGLVLLSLQPRTGRTHQLRVHLPHLGGAILGDGKYGQRLPNDWTAPRRLYLHAARLEIDHPKGGLLELHAPLPSAFEQALGA